MIFFTDGCDTSNNKNVLMNSFQEMQGLLQSLPNLNSKFMAIGFSRNHDAVFMNELAKAGSKIGNFIYIDQSKEGWQKEVNAALGESLDIALSGSAPFKFGIANNTIQFTRDFVGEMNYVYAETEDEEEAKEDVADKVERIVFVSQGIVPNECIQQDL